MNSVRALGVFVIALAVLAVAPCSDAFAASAVENFQRYCTQCHGPEGKGNGVNATKDLPATPKNLTNADELSQLSDERIADIIVKGGARNELSPIMPPWGNTLTAEEIQDLVRFIRGLCGCTFRAR